MDTGNWCIEDYIKQYRILLKHFFNGKFKIFIYQDPCTVFVWVVAMIKCYIAPYNH